MTIHPILILLLLGHVLGDFYFQWNTMAEKKRDSSNKKTQFLWLLMHSGVYFLCIAAILFIGAGVSRYWWFVVLGVSIIHLLIDLIKICIPYKKTFIIDQALHLASIIILWRLWGECLSIPGLSTLLSTLRELSGAINQTPAELALITLGLLWILKPVGILIKQGDIWDFNHGAPNEKQKGAGKMIGYLERIIVFVLLINGEFSAIAFVLAAKSVMRFKEIGTDENASLPAEFYIIGTLLSMTSVFVITFLLGLIGSMA